MAPPHSSRSREMWRAIANNGTLRGLSGSVAVRASFIWFICPTIDFERAVSPTCRLLQEPLRAYFWTSEQPRETMPLMKLTVHHAISCRPRTFACRRAWPALPTPRWSRRLQGECILMACVHARTFFDMHSHHDEDSGTTSGDRAVAQQHSEHAHRFAWPFAFFCEHA